MPGVVVDMARHESLSVMPGVVEQLVLEDPQPFCAVHMCAVPVHMLVVQAPPAKVGVPAKPALHSHVPAPPVASPSQVDCLSVTRLVKSVRG